MLKESNDDNILQRCVNYYEATGSHELYFGQIDKVQSQRDILFKLLKFFFRRAGMENEKDMNKFFSEKDESGVHIRPIKNAEWFYAVNGLEDTGKEISGMTMNNWKNAASMPKRALLIQLAFYLGLNAEETDKLLKTADHQGLYSRDFRDLIVAFYLNQGFCVWKGKIPNAKDAKKRIDCVRGKICSFRATYLKEKNLIYDAKKDIYYYTSKLNGDIQVNKLVKNISEEIYRDSIVKEDLKEDDLEEFLKKHMEELEIRRMGAIHMAEKYISDRNSFFKYLKDSEKYNYSKESGKYEYHRKVQTIFKELLNISGASNYDYIMEGRKALERELYRAPETNIYTLVLFCFVTGNDEPEKVNRFLQRFGFREISNCEGEYSRLDFFLNYLYRVADIDIIKNGKTSNNWLNLVIQRHNYCYFKHKIFQEYWEKYGKRTNRGGK